MQLLVSFAFSFFYTMRMQKIVTGFFYVGLILVLLGSCKPKTENSDATSNDSIPKDLILLNKKIEAEPNNADNYNARANYYLDKKDFPSAAKDMVSAIHLDSTKSSYFVTMADIFFMSGQSGKSKRSLEKSLLLDSNNIQALQRMAELYLYIKDNKKSISYLDKILHLDVHNAKAYFTKGVDFKELGDTAKAISSFQTVVEQDPEYYHAYIQLGLLFEAKHNPLALEYYTAALKLNPKSVEAMYNMAMYCQENNKYNKAIEIYTNILKLDPQNKYANYNLGYIHYQFLKVYDVAAKHFTNAINCDNNYAQAVYMRGLCYETLGDIAKAAVDYNQALKIDPDYDKPAEGLQRLKK